MARAKSFERYPLSYGQLMVDAAERPVEVPCGSKARARSFRNELYTYRSVLLDYTDEVQGDYEMMLAILADFVQFRIEDTSVIVELRLPSNSFSTLILNSIPSQEPAHVSHKPSY